jgi:hypothetical protein
VDLESLDWKSWNRGWAWLSGGRTNLSDAQLPPNLPSVGHLFALQYLDLGRLHAERVDSPRILGLGRDHSMYRWVSDSVRFDPDLGSVADTLPVKKGEFQQLPDDLTSNRKSDRMAEELNQPPLSRWI